MPYYTETNREVLLAFMRQYPFVQLCGTDAAGYPVATHVPVLLKEREGKLFLQGHIMRKTGHHKAFEANAAALAVFSGPHTYVSASWYSNPQQGSTWNYQTVHAKGLLRFLDQPQLLQVLEELTTLFEQDPGSAAAYSRLPEEYVQKMAQAIVAFEIEVTGLDATFKLSQNRDKASYENIIAQLQQQGGDAALVAAEMEKRSPFNTHHSQQ